LSEFDFSFFRCFLILYGCVQGMLWTKPLKKFGSFTKHSETLMERRSFLSKATVGAGVGAVALAAPAIANAQPVVRWRCSSGFPKALDTIFGAAEDAAKRISDATGGKFQISVAPAGEIVPMPQAADAVAAGTVECSHTAAFYYVGKDPAWAFGSCIPFGMNFRQMNAWWKEGGGRKMFNDFLAPQGIQYVLSGNTGAQMGGWFRKEINSMEDVKGLKMRIPGLGGRLFSAVGAVPQQIPGGDIYPALERGTIDAAEWVGPYDDEKLGFNKVAKFYYYPGFWEGGAALGWIVNNKAMDALTPEYRNIFMAAAHEANADMMAKYDARNGPALKRLIAGGTQVKPFPRPVLEGFYKAALPMYAEIGAGNANFKRLYDSYSSFQKDSVAWMRFTENTFDDFMAQMLRT
jgi:TRAP-type mannitol/chloroaromatic compound transport system substrate-binding protein